MPPKVQKSKAAKLLAAQSASKSKGKKKKWAKGKMREKKNNRVVFTAALHDTALATATKKTRLLTLYRLIEQYKIGGALARKLIKELLANGAIKPVLIHGNMSIYAPVSTDE